jgi:hypothetical protein
MFGRFGSKDLIKFFVRRCNRTFFIQRFLLAFAHRCERQNEIDLRTDTSR